MVLRDKFIKKDSSEEESVLICSSTHHMLQADRLLRQHNFKVELVPTPRGIGSACTTAIRFAKNLKEEIKDVIMATDIDWKGIYDIEKKNRLEDWKDIWNLEINSKFSRVLKKIAKDEVLNISEIKTLLKANRESELEALFLAANRIREEAVKDTVDVRAAIEFSNYCHKNCNYCGLRRENKNLTRYRMTEDEIIKVTKEIYELGIETVILQSGEDPWYTTDKIVKIIRRIKEEFGMKITLSLGERTKKEYKVFKEAGADNYLLKIEAANKDLFNQIHPDDNYEVRSKHTKWLKELGYITGSGGMIGLPSQSIEDLAKDILFQKKYGIHMIGVGPFLPANNTPYAEYKSGDLITTLKVVAVMRLVCQNVFIPATTAIASLDSEGQEKALESGANVIMLIMTPPQLRENYEIYSNKNMVDLDWAVESIMAANRKIPEYLNLDKLNRIDRSEVDARYTTG
ncbi:[FeFe] hydrogenase H-cluster radical SAM maturase HydE [Selenihalanaerobacter shriftii]|uniref:Iron-only hydrogenase maturation protein HydE n=1 Tax=Selenihalanaerobacter shriftii TaxID=142842 RepID=A0A1T4NM05_9FIRM|nr:[FeFe] hydrogenase H-cluster radical SAM maturase HydE [Selenihalanaerobacter shriftii]SJZ80146.1 iron-only hydrogenase maturation protein HydE [Selenihalanaerobacter shriftii]